MFRFKVVAHDVCPTNTDPIVVQCEIVEVSAPEKDMRDAYQVAGTGSGGLVIGGVRIFESGSGRTYTNVNDGMSAYSPYLLFPTTAVSDAVGKRFSIPANNYQKFVELVRAYNTRPTPDAARLAAFAAELRTLADKYTK